MEPPNEPLETATIMAKPQDKVIISCAVTGAMHTPTMSPYLPITPDQIAEQSIEAAEAGHRLRHEASQMRLAGDVGRDEHAFRAGAGQSLGDLFTERMPPSRDDHGRCPFLGHT